MDRASLVIIKYGDGSVATLEDDDAELIEDFIDNCINSGNFFNTMASYRSIQDYVNSTAYIPSFSSIYVPDDDEEDEENEIETVAISMKRYLIEGDIEKAKKVGYRIKYDAYGRAYIKALLKPNNDSKGEFKFKDWTVTP